MTDNPFGFSAYMKENAQVSRWELYRLWCFFFLFVSVGFASAETEIFEHPMRTLVFVLGVLVITLAIFVLGFWRDRGYERVELVFWSVVLVMLLAIVWYGLQRHRDNMQMTSEPHLANHP